jgi:pyruvate formate lyase activating enzyme
VADQNALTLGGLVPFSTVDFPGRLAAVLFTQGCPLRCRYCHNPHLRRRTSGLTRDWPATLAWLRRRTGLLDAVVFSGGEPTVQPGLADALAEVRDLGFATGLHSAGTHPRRLAQVLKLRDWVALDVKAPFDRYAVVTGSPRSGAQARRALDAVLASGISYELRTTVHAALLGAADLLAITEDLQARWVRRWVLQAFRPTGCVDPALLTPTRPGWLDAVLPSLRALVPDIVVR